MRRNRTDEEMRREADEYFRTQNAQLDGEFLGVLIAAAILFVGVFIYIQ